MQRLATGQKTEVDKKSMKKLTEKNYENLPEVVKKKEEAQKKEELKKRMLQAKEYAKTIGQRRKTINKKKQDQQVEESHIED